MPCPTENLIFRFASGRLGRAEALALDQHFDTCTDCRELLAEAVRRPGEEPSRIKGTQLGRYVLLEPLGAGSMGVVYAAYDPELDRQVAIKLLHPGDQSPNHQRRLMREGQTMARLKHPNVVSVYDAGSIEGHAFVAMELISGVNLRRWLAERPPDPLAVLELMAQAGQGLHAAHAAGIVHRDFKPENVLIDSNGGVHITDFGLARLPDAPNAVMPMQARQRPAPRREVRPPPGSTAFSGTPAYMAPEQQRGWVDARSDQYAFCVVLHEALFGARPDEGKSPLAPKLPVAVPKALARGLSVDPADRFPSMSALLEALAERAAVVVKRAPAGAARTPKKPVG